MRVCTMFDSDPSLLQHGSLTLNVHNACVTNTSHFVGDLNDKKTRQNQVKTTQIIPVDTDVDKTVLEVCTKLACHFGDLKYPFISQTSLHTIFQVLTPCSHM